MRSGSPSGVSSRNGPAICLRCGRKVDNKEDLADVLTDSVCLLFGKAETVTLKFQVFCVQGE